MKKKTVRKLEFLLHLVTALLLLLKGYDEISRQLFFSGFILSGLAIIILIIILFWKPLRIKPKEARTLCYYIEAPALLLTAYVFHLEKKDYISHIFFISALMYPALGFISSKKFRKIKKSAL